MEKNINVAKYSRLYETMREELRKVDAQEILTREERLRILQQPPLLESLTQLQFVTEKFLKLSRPLQENQMEHPETYSYIKKEYDMNYDNRQVLLFELKAIIDDTKDDPQFLTFQNEWNAFTKDMIQTHTGVFHSIRDNTIIQMTESDPDKLYKSLFLHKKDAINYFSFSHPEYDQLQFRVLEDALQNGLNVTKMIEKPYRAGQMKEIMYGLIAGIDPTPYCNPDMKFNDMKKARLAIQNGADLSAYVDPNKKRLYVDMDGTLAKYNIVPYKQLYEEGYFLNLEPHETVVEAVKEIIHNYPDVEVNILSAVLTDSPYALEEKQKWLDQYLPEIPFENRIFPPCGTDKKEAILGGVRPNDFLLEDYTNNLTLWEPPAKGIKLLNGMNATNGTWKGNQLDFTKSGKELAEDIFAIMSHGIRIADIPPQKRSNPKQPNVVKNSSKKNVGIDIEL